MNEGLYWEGMALIDFARGPALKWSVIIFLIGVVWRLGALLLYTRPDLSRPREASLAPGLKTLLTRSAPPHELEKNIKFQHYTGYAWHIGMFIVLLFFAPHIEFFKGILGFGWPSMPNLVIHFFTVMTIAAFLPFLTGIMAFTHVTFGIRYETMLALHILSVCFLLVWFPFSKLMHAIVIWPSRYKVGAAFGRRGIRA